MLEDVGPGTTRLGELRAGRRAVARRPVRDRLRAAARRPPPAARRRRRRHRAAGDLAGRALAQGSREDGSPRGCSARCRALGSATRRAPAPRCSPRARVATDDGSVGHQGPVTDLLLAELGQRPARRGLRLRPARRCSRPCARSAPSTAIPAQLALESGMACGYGACFGCVVPTKDGYVRLCVDGPVLDADTLTSDVTMSVPRPRATRSSTRQARSTRSPLAVRSVTPCSSASRSPRS